MTDDVLYLLADALVALGAVTTSIAVYGLIRLPTLYTRIHAASKVAVLGVVPILLASVATEDLAFIARALLMIISLVVTTPVAAHSIGRAAYMAGPPADPVDSTPASS